MSLCDEMIPVCLAIAKTYNSNLSYNETSNVFVTVTRCEVQPEFVKLIYQIKTNWPVCIDLCLE